MMKVLANDGISQSGIDLLNKNGFEVITEKVNQDDLVQEINDKNYVALLVRSATTARKELIDACPNLKLIGRGGVGMDNIDVDYARSKGVHVINTPGASSQSVAELVMGHMFSLARGLQDSNRQMSISGNSEFKNLKKKYSKGKELREKTLGIIGLGRIGKAAATYALGIGMKVIATDMYVTDGEIELNIVGHGSIKVNVPLVSFQDLIRQSDFISIHVPKQNNGNAVISAKEFSVMKDGVIIINAARGGVVEESDLLAAIDSGKIGGIALDVFENEPNPNPSLLSSEKMSLSPHIGAATTEAQDRIGVELADQIMKLLK